MNNTTSSSGDINDQLIVYIDFVKRKAKLKLFKSLMVQSAISLT